MPKVNEVKANSLAIKGDVRNIVLEGITQGNKANADAFKNSDNKTSTSVLKVYVPQAVLSTVGNNGAFNVNGSNATINTLKIVPTPNINETVSFENMKFKILTKDNIGDDANSFGTVAITDDTSNNIVVTNVSLNNGILSFNKDNVTFHYKLVEIGNGKTLTNPNFNVLKENLQNVVKIGANAFTGLTLPEKLEFPALTTIDENAFKGALGISSLILPALKNPDNINVLAFGSNKTDFAADIFVDTDDLNQKLSNKLTNKELKVRTIGAPTIDINSKPFVDNTNKKRIVINTTKNLKGSLFANEFIILVNGNRADIVSGEILNNSIHLYVKNAIKFNDKDITVSYTGKSVTDDNSQVPKLLENFANQEILNKVTLVVSQANPQSSAPQYGSAAIVGGENKNNSQDTKQDEKDKTQNEKDKTQNEKNEQQNENSSNSTIVKNSLTIDNISLPKIGSTIIKFNDVEDNHWAKSSISKLSSAGIINGVGDNSFNPNETTKRADAIVLLTRLIGLDGISKESFNDVSPNAYYTNAVGLAKEYGIISGSPDGNFNPEQNIKRQDIMVMVSRILNILNIETNSNTSILNQFSDVNDISSYAKEHIANLVNAGIISGSLGKINPNQYITRAEIAVILDKVYDKINNTINI